MPLLKAVRSLCSMLLVALLFFAGSLVLRLAVIPTAWLVPGRRAAVTTAYFKAMAHGILALLSLGGARFRRIGTLATGSPTLVIANHQSLLDILQIVLLARPQAPAYVTRKRYSRFVPLVSATLRLLRAPVIDPKRDPDGALEAMRRAAQSLPNGIVLFVEGHRSRNGRLLPFRTAGAEAVLRARPMPVQLVLNEGLWKVGRLTDLLFRVHLIDATTELVGRFDPPADPCELQPFLLGLRRRLDQRLSELRAPAPAGADRASASTAEGPTT